MKKQIQRKQVFGINAEQKRRITDMVIESTKSLNAIKISVRLLTILAIGGSALYIFLNLVLNSWSIAYVNGEPVKDYLHIFMTGGIILVAGILLTVATQLLLNLISSKDLTARYNERAEIEANTLRYTYSDKRAKSNIERITATIPLNSAIEAHYDPKLHKMTFAGAIDAVYHENTKQGKKLNRTTKDSIVMYDYYNPSLHYALRKSGMNFCEDVDDE